MMLNATLKRWLFCTLICVLSAWLSGCAQGSSGLDASGQQQVRTDLQTESDETPNQRRARIRLELATAYFQQGQTHVALDEVKQAIAIEPAYADAYSLRGLVYLRLNNLPLASDSFERVLALNPRDADAAHNYAWLLCQNDRYEASDKLFAQALGNPRYAQPAKSWMAQGLCQIRAGQISAAEASLSRSHALDASNPVTSYNLARLLFERGQVQPAQPYVRQLNAGPLANAESLWLGIKIERQLNNPQGVVALADQLRDRFVHSRALIAYDKGAFPD
jgi:type IV pilus assembly protein PilF